MADLKSLIKVRKHDVEQRQKQLAKLYRQDEDLIEKKQSLHDKVEKERTAMKTMDSQMQQYFGPFADAIKKQVLKIDERRETLAKQITIAREAMRDAFAEMKKVEISQENRDTEEANERNRADTKRLDDIGVERFGRKS